MGNQPIAELAESMCDDYSGSPFSLGAPHRARDAFRTPHRVPLLLRVVICYPALYACSTLGFKHQDCHGRFVFSRPPRRQRMGEENRGVEGGTWYDLGFSL